MAVKLTSSDLTNAYDASTAPYAIPNIIDTSIAGNSKCQIGCYMYKSWCVNRNHTYAEHIKGCIEPDAGAHYYARGPFLSSYRTATATIKMSEVQINPEKRNGYLCLALVSTGSQMTQLDFGLGYIHNASTPGWYPYVWSAGATAVSKPGFYGSGTQQLIPNDAEVNLTLTVSKDSINNITYDIVTCTLQYGGTTCTAIYSATAGAFFNSTYTNPLVRFVRFMSLVPLSSSTTSYDDADGSYLNGTFRNLALTNHSGSAYTWNSSLLDYAWSVQGANISKLQISDLTSNDIGSNSDTCNIIHRYSLHPEE